MKQQPGQLDAVVKIREFDLLQYMDLPDIHHLSPEDQRLVLESQQRITSAQDEKMLVAMESFAELLDKVGLHNESRKYFQNIISSTTEILTQARCWRKIAFSYNSQRDPVNAGKAVTTAAALIRSLSLNNNSEKEEYVRILHDEAYSYYFQLKSEKLEDIVKDIKRYLPDITDIELRCNLFHAISLSMFSKYRWNRFPEESFTHLELQLQLTSKLQNKFHLGYTHCIIGLFYLFNEEFALSREHFTKGIEILEGKHFGQLMMAYNYTALGYRMQNNISMTEKWTLQTMEKAKHSGNLFYVHSSYANLAWVYAKRDNWLYAEDYARKAAANWSAIALAHCYAFPLIECSFRKGELNEAGELAFKLLHPKLKKLPDTIIEKLRTVVKSWALNKESALSKSLEDLIYEAKLTGYF